MSEIMTTHTLTQVTDDIDEVVKVLNGNRVTSSGQIVDIANPEERKRLLTLRADISKQITTTRRDLDVQKEELKKWNEKVNALSNTVKPFTFRKFEYATSGYPFDTEEEQRTVFAALSRAEQWGNAEYSKQLKELAKLEKRRDFFKENVMVLEANLELLKGTHTELDYKIKGKKKDNGVQ